VPVTGVLDDHFWFMIAAMSGSMSVVFFVMWSKVKKHRRKQNEFTTIA